MDACQQYFQWVQDNPLQEEKVFVFQGRVTRANVSKMRAMTIGGLCIFLGISKDTWNSYRNSEDFSAIACEVDEIIRDQKFTGAAADLLNPNIIARDLGLKDTSKLEGSGENGEHLVQNTVADDLRTALDAIAGKIASGDKPG